MFPLKNLARKKIKCHFGAFQSDYEVSKRVTNEGVWFPLDYSKRKVLLMGADQPIHDNNLTSWFSSVISCETIHKVKKCHQVSNHRKKL